VRQVPRKKGIKAIERGSGQQANKLTSGRPEAKDMSKVTDGSTDGEAKGNDDAKQHMTGTGCEAKGDDDADKSKVTDGSTDGEAKGDDDAKQHLTGTGCEAKGDDDADTSKVTDGSTEAKGDDDAKQHMTGTGNVQQQFARHTQINPASLDGHPHHIHTRMHGPMGPYICSRKWQGQPSNKSAIVCVHLTNRCL
jgi:hypothetical protein